MKHYEIVDLVMRLQVAESNIRHFRALTKYEDKAVRHLQNAEAQYKCSLNTLINKVSEIPSTI